MVNKRFKNSLIRTAVTRNKEFKKAIFQDILNYANVLVQFNRNPYHLNFDKDAPQLN